MKRGFLAIVVLAAVLCPRAASGGEDGLGIIVGEPTGVSYKHWFGMTHAFDMAAAWSFSGANSFQFHADYLVHNFDEIDMEEARGDLALYIGVGGRMKLNEEDNKGNNEDVMLGVRVPLGASYFFESAPFELFLEIVPVLDIVPDTEFDINGAVGFRFYFGSGRRGSSGGSGARDTRRVDD